MHARRICGSSVSQCMTMFRVINGGGRFASTGSVHYQEFRRQSDRQRSFVFSVLAASNSLFVTSPARQQSATEHFERETENATSSIDAVHACPWYQWQDLYLYLPCFTYGSPQAGLDSHICSFVNCSLNLITIHYTVSNRQNTRHLIFDHNIDKYKPIFEIRSVLNVQGNLYITRYQDISHNLKCVITLPLKSRTRIAADFSDIFAWTPQNSSCQFVAQLRSEFLRLQVQEDGRTCSFFHPFSFHLIPPLPTPVNPARRSRVKAPHCGFRQNLGHFTLKWLLGQN